MYLVKWKDRLYYYIVDKNSLIKREYDQYVADHLEEHKKKRLKHWFMLGRLNWHYRIRKSMHPIYKRKTRGFRLPYLNGAESELLNRRPPQHFIKELINCDIISFDIFDTLLLRPFSNPKTLFQFLEENNGIMHFAMLRREAEEEVRKESDEVNGHREIDIFDIYHYIEKKTGLKVEEGVQAEIEAEMEFCFSNPYMKRVYDMLVSYGKKIIITSDMYIPSENLKLLLEKNGYNTFEKLYVSCEYKKSKATGELYKIIEDDLGNHLSYVHVGDNFHSDINMAKENGWKSVYYKNVNIAGNPYRSDGMSEFVGSAYSGIVNYHLHNGTNQYTPQYEFGFIYGGLYVLGFVNWIHSYAVEHNLEKVIFLARDGDIYKRIYDELYSDIPSEYFYWSRIATVKYSLEKNRYDFLRRNVLYRTLNNPKSTLEEVLYAMDISFLKSTLKDYELEADEELTTENAKMFEEFLIDNIEQISIKYRNGERFVKDYVSSTIGTAKKVALVDVGWAGSGPISLRDLIKKWGMDCEVECLLAASSLNNESISAIQSQKVNSYIFSRMYNRNHFDSHFSPRIGRIANDIFEIFTQSCAPSFAGFEITEDDWQFSYALPSIEGYKYIQEIHQGIEDFVLLYIKHYKKYPYLLNISGYDAYCPFRLIMRDLSFIKNYLGDFPCETNTGKSSIPIALSEYIEMKGI